MEAGAKDDRAVARWALRTRDSCKELRMSEFCGAGAVQYHARRPEFAAKRNEIVHQAKGLLKHLQQQIFADIAGRSTSDTVETIKEYVFSTTEHIDKALDRHDEELKHGKKTSGPQGKKRSKADNSEDAGASAKRAKTRPQDLFEPPVDNSNTPFWPDFEHLKGIATDLGPDAQPEPELDSTADARGGSPIQARKEKTSNKLARHAAQLAPDNGSTIKATYKHPFTTALEELSGQYPQWMLQSPPPRVPEPIKEQSFTFVEDASALAEMAEHLSTVREFAVDLEHSSGSFQGFTCLMQISSRSRDYIIDTLALRPHMGAALARPFADPAILKVLHGANSDVMWLQKDFGLFLVNMMDTGQAAAILDLPRGLAGLLQHFCQVSTDKSFQRCDWCVRPLTKAMLHYAQTDTHFLLYIADQLREKLLAAGEVVPPTFATPLPQPGPQGALGTALERSRQLCMHLYEKPLFTSQGPVCTYIQQYNALDVQLNPKQQAAFAALVAWRDVMCRQLDEGIGRMMPRWLLKSLSQTLPRTAAEVAKVVGKKLGAKEYTKEIADIVMNSQNHPIETPLDVQMAAPNGIDHSTQHEVTAQASLSADQDFAATADRMRASEDPDFPQPSEEEAPCVDTQDAPSSCDYPAENCDASTSLGKGPAAVAAVPASNDHMGPQSQQTAVGRVEPLFSFAGLPIKSVGFGGKEGGSKQQVSKNQCAAAPAPTTVAVTVSQGTAAIPQRSMASMFGAPAAAPSVAVAAAKKPAVKSMAGMFGAPAPKAPKTVRKIEISSAVKDGSAVASASLPDGAAAATVQRVDDDSAAGSRDAGQQKNDVRSAMASLREHASEQAGAAGEGEGGCDGGNGYHGASCSHGEVAGRSQDDDLTSLRERYQGKKRSHRNSGGEHSPGNGKKRDSGAVLGDVTAIAFSKKVKMADGDVKLRGGVQQGQRHERKREAAEFEEVFDYEAVLDGSDRQFARARRSHGGRDGRGRGQRAGGGRRGDRGSGGGRKAWNPFQVSEADVGAAKRSGNSRNGNKSAAFGNTSRR